MIKGHIQKSHFFTQRSHFFKMYRICISTLDPRQATFGKKIEKKCTVFFILIFFSRIEPLAISETNSTWRLYFKRHQIYNTRSSWNPWLLLIIRLLLDILSWCLEHYKARLMENRHVKLEAKVRVWATPSVPIRKISKTGILWEKIDNHG